jgi:putative copper export protein
MTINISNILNRKSARWLVLALVALMTIASIALVGPAAAQLDGTETKFYNDTTRIDVRERGSDE